MTKIFWLVVAALHSIATLSAELKVWSFAEIHVPTCMYTDYMYHSKEKLTDGTGSDECGIQWAPLVFFSRMGL